MRSGYATLPDVNSLLSFVPTFTATSKPNATQVTNFIAMASDDLDAALSLQNYITPVPSSATASFELLRDWSSVGAAYYTAAAMPQGIDSKHLSIYERRWDAILMGLNSGDLELGADVPKDPSKSGTRYWQGPLPANATPYFTRDSLSQ